MQKVLLVDDERLARTQLRTQLSHFPEVQVVAEADCVPQALEAAGRHKPDAVFLDIQMPGQNAFDFLAQATGNFRVIFVTAYHEFALRAFEVNALDYLMKPVRFERLADAVARLTSLDPAARGAALAPLEDSDYLFVSGGSGARFVKVRTIKYIQAAGSYTEVFTANGSKCMLLQPLKNWEERLPPARFVRTHRSCVVNLDFVERLENLGNETYQLFLRGLGSPLPVSRRFALALKNRFR
jgi:two-component system, LytTR family, response regulator